MPSYITEDQIEKGICKIFKEELGYELLNAYTADKDNLNDKTNRTDKSEVVLQDILKSQLLQLNPEIPEIILDSAIARLTEQSYHKTPLAANKEVYFLIRDGILVEYEDKNGKKIQTYAKVIDFENPNNNHFIVVRQLWIKGSPYYRRPDIILYLNGLPLIFIELKNSNVKLKTAYTDNLSTYRKEIPQLFVYNVCCILSNALETRVGSFDAEWEFFFNWLRISDEKEKINRKKIEEDKTSLEKIVKGLCKKEKLLDYIENFILYYDNKTKIIAQNHQFLGVNNAIESFQEREKKEGKLGVFWHTQGSGKSFSMIFLTRKIKRKFHGNFTFVIITDREDLDGQIYKNFVYTETLSKTEKSQPSSSKIMREYLSKNKPFIFTLIQKFRWDKGKKYPVLSERKDIIVIVDEAHRTQYEELAKNMRDGLPEAQFFAFTGTPLLGRERKTSSWFGDYVSEYNFSQSIDDGATVPLFYQKRVPEVLIQNDADLNEKFYEYIEEEAVEKNTSKDKLAEKLEKAFIKEIEVIKRDDRLEKIAQDIVEHFPRRGYLGKGMVICVDKFTAVKMYEKVDRHWKEEKKKLQKLISNSKSDMEKHKLNKILNYMRNLEMAVIVSEEGEEEKKFQRENLNIKIHRDKMNKIDENGHDIEYRFKDPTDNLQLVFVCAMWLTGFDAPTVSTLYLDKPMKGHTLMQTIARANRVSSYSIGGVFKKNGEVIDYYNVFRNMKKALADYALGSEGMEESPIQDKSELIRLLHESIHQGVEFCKKIGIDLNEVLSSGKVFREISLFEKYANSILSKDEYRVQFNVFENAIESFYQACKPEIFKELPPLVPVFQYLRGILDSRLEGVDIESLKVKISELLDETVITSDKDLFGNVEEKGLVIKKGKILKLSELDFEKLKSDFKTSQYKNIEIADLRSFLEDRLEKMMNQNSTRGDFARRFQDIINRYNSDSTSQENFFDDLMSFAKDLKEEEERHIREGLDEDELELFDIIKKDKLIKKEEERVKNAAKALLRRIVEGHPKILVHNWYKDSQYKQKVKSALEEVLDAELPESYDRITFKKTCDNVFNLVYEFSSKGIKWAA